MEKKHPFPMLRGLVIMLLMIVFCPVGIKAQPSANNGLEAPSKSSLPPMHASARMLRGDVDFDGARSLIDIMLLVDYILTEQPTFELKYGDMDDDGEISLVDITILVDIILGGTYIDPDDPSFPIGGSEGGDPAGGL